MKASPLFLSNNILLRGELDKIKITPMKLQRLLYYTCCGYLQVSGSSAIDEQFEVWKYGPVLPSVHLEFAGFAGAPITEYATDALGHIYCVHEKDNPILTGSLNMVWKLCRNYSGKELSRFAQLPNSGWYKALKRNDLKISIEDMRAENFQNFQGKKKKCGFNIF